MDSEIERKFLINKLPNLKGKTKEEFERYYFFRGNGIEIRIQRINITYEFERKVRKSKLGSRIYKFPISREEFEYFKPKNSDSIIRDNYKISVNLNVSVKIYHERFEGLVRVEVEFNTEKEANKFTPLDWMGREITNSPLGRDSRLLDLSDKEFNELIR